MDNNVKINLTNIKILFLGYGGVAKCVLTYFKYYFEYNLNNIYLIDKYDKTFYGPVQDQVPNKNKINIKIQSENFDNVVVRDLGFNKGDLIIDLTYHSNTYFFVKRCLELGINYINTSIEDYNDNLMGSSICLQQKIIKDIFRNFNKNIECNILIEFGQNPGLIQHYLVYAFNKLNNKKNSLEDIWDLKKLTHVIDDYKIGTILLSEIDNMVKKNENMNLNKIYNTWSVSGLLGEGLDYSEIVYGKKNKYIKPIIPNKFNNKERENLLNVNLEKNKNSDSYSVLFLNEMGINCTLNSICPVINNDDKIKLENYYGKLIHHGEIFEFGDIFGVKSPFMSYCYKINRYAEKSIKEFIKNNNITDPTDLKLNINNLNDNFVVYDNYNSTDNDKIIGHDSIGCTIFCGDTEIEKIFWCGSILSSNDIDKSNMFTPTIIQVAAGVLSGISYIMESKNKNKGLLFSCDLDTKYILKKSLWLLGDFGFFEIPIKKFGNQQIKLKLDKIL